MTGRLIAGGSPVRIEIRDQSHIGECRRGIKQLADAYGFNEEDTGKAAIVATELATNVMRHGGGGEMLMQALDDGTSPQLELLAIDSGAGMRDIEQCMQDGYSTGGTQGTGLGAVSRLSLLFDIFSTPDKGTVVLSRIGRRQDSAAHAALEYGAVCLPVAGERECGDTWRVADGGPAVAMLVVDGLGHGALAASAAQGAAAIFANQPFGPLPEAMQNLHRGLLGGRGAVGAIAHLQVEDARVDYAGIGNISGTIVTRERTQGMVSYNGALGVQEVRPRQFTYDLPADSLVVMHSDGLSARWSISEHPGLFNQHPAVIAAVLYRGSARKRDDVTVIVVRYRS
jgi:anti-sigma regulatory factor (Ser/Thr protein kinase)